VSYCRTRGVVRASSAVDLWSNSGRRTVRPSDSSTERSWLLHPLFELCSYDLGTRRSWVSPGRTGVGRRSHPPCGFDCWVTAQSRFEIQEPRRAWLRAVRRSLG
jgi:hypothetical protein